MRLNVLAAGFCLALVSCSPVLRADYTGMAIWDASHWPDELPDVQIANSPHPQPSSTPTPTPVPSPKALRRVTINVSGDLLWHNTLWTSAQQDASRTGRGQMDFFPQLAHLQSFVSRASIGICHSEVPFAPPQGPFRNFPLFAAPPSIAPALKEVGWDICTTASNHTMDGGWPGVVRTIETHEEAGLRTVGTYRTREEAETPTIYEAAGVKVGFVSQAYGLNGLSRPADKPWAVSLLDANKAIADARKAKEAGADIVGVHMHAGTEYSRELNREQIDFVAAVTASEHVDFVFGQHAHVVQPIDRVNGKWVVYGAGNLIAQSGPPYPYTYDGYMAEFTFTETSPGVFDSELIWAPTHITRHRNGSPARVYLIPEALDQGIGPTTQLKESAARTRAIVGQVPGLRELGQADNN